MLTVVTSYKENIPLYLYFSLRNRGLTASPRRPPMSELSRSGYRSYTSPELRLSKKLGASLPNLTQPVSDTLNVISSNRLLWRKMTPDIGQSQ